MNSRIKITIKAFLILICLSWSPLSYSQSENKNSFQGLDYPELQVAPRASERLQALSLWEQDRWFLSQWTMFTSSALTFTAATQLNGNYRESNFSAKQKTDSDLSAKTGQAVGLGWMGVSLFLMNQKQAHTSWVAAARMPSKDRRQELTKERYAEEALESQSLLQDRLETLAMASNFITSSYMISWMNDDIRPYGYVALIGSALPWIFESEYVRQYKKHRESKRKIYSPLVFVDLQEAKQAKMNFVWEF